MRGSLRVLALLALLVAPASAQTVRNITMRVVFVTYAENRNHWTSDIPGTGASIVARANTFWNGPAASWGAITYTGTTYPTWIDSTQSMAGGCSLGQIFLDVRSAVGSPPANAVNVVVLPPGSPCNDLTSGATVYTVAGGAIEHEVGHTLGLQHSHDTVCDAVNGCGSVEYGNGDLMGASGIWINAVERAQLNLFSSTFQQKTVTTDQDVTLQTINSMTSGIKALVANGGVGHALTAELHAADSASFGVTLHGPPGNYQLDLDKVTTGQRFRMNVGETYCDGTFVCLTLVALTSDTATLHASFPGAASLPSPINHTR